MKYPNRTSYYFYNLIHTHYNNTAANIAIGHGTRIYYCFENQRNNVTNLFREMLNG